jgi:hypothetical protein
MKHMRYLVFLTLAGFFFSSCSLFKPKYGCGDNGGRNVGAEKYISGEPPKKQKKFKA